MSEKRMNLGIYCVRDKVVDTFGLPFCAENDAVALRHFVSCYIHLDDNVISDFSIVEVAQFDPDNGSVHGYDTGCFREVYNGTEILSHVMGKRQELFDIEMSVEAEIEELKKLKKSIDNKEVKQ